MAYIVSVQNALVSHEVYALSLSEARAAAAATYETFSVAMIGVSVSIRHMGDQPRDCFERVGSRGVWTESSAPKPVRAPEYADHWARTG